MPTDAELLKGLGSGAPPSNEAIGGTILALSQSEGTCTYEFRPGQMVLNAGGFIAAGYLTQMLDQACAIAGIAATGLLPTTLEIKTTCLRAARMGVFVAEARVLKSGRSIAFLEASLRNSDGELIATATTTANLIGMAKLREKNGSA